MRTILFIFALCTSFSMIAQREVGAKDPAVKLTDSRWKTDYHCFVSDSVISYTLTPVPEFEWNWGNFISFTDSTFYTDYSAPCGLDCFTNVSGTFKFVGHNEIEVFVQSISREGFCNEETGQFEINRSYGVYRFESNKDGALLLRRKDQK